MKNLTLKISTLTLAISMMGSLLAAQEEVVAQKPSFSNRCVKTVVKYKRPIMITGAALAVTTLAYLGYKNWDRIKPLCAGLPALFASSAPAKTEESVTTDIDVVQNPVAQDAEQKEENPFADGLNNLLALAKEALTTVTEAAAPTVEAVSSELNNRTELYS